MNSPHLAPREKAAILWAEHVTRNTARTRDDVYQGLRKYFSEPEIVELTLICGFFNMFNRFMDALKIPVELPKEVDKIKRSVVLDPGKVKAYLETVVATWPSNFPQPDPDG